MKTKENGITLVALVIMIVLILILASIGYTVGDSTINSAKFTQFRNELKVMQTKVNELNQENKTDVGQDITEVQKTVLEKQEISDIIYNGKSEEEKTKIKNGFRYLSQNYIKEALDLEGVSRDYLINVENRYVVFPDGFEYEGSTYYMINQIDGEIYNVEYKDKNEKSGNFDVSVTGEDNRCKVEISNIQYNGYVDKWQVKYRLKDSSYWDTSDNLSFYLRDEGIYEINVVHGDEINLGTQTVNVICNGLISDKIESNLIKIGDYVKYTPDTLDNNALQTLKNNLNSYSGKSSSTVNSAINRDELNWRILDITDDGQVRLISAEPTTSKIELYGFNGYNNAVKLLDDSCSTLYTNSKLSSKVQNLKIEDITKYMKTKPADDTTVYKPTNINYPKILEQEENQTIEATNASLSRIGISSQNEFVTGRSTSSSNSLKKTYYKQPIGSADYFENSKYYEMFMKKDSSNYQKVYWVSSRCVNAGSWYADYYVRNVSSGNIDAGYLYHSDNSEGGNECGLRPVITLNTNVQVTEGEGTMENPYKINL